MDTQSIAAETTRAWIDIDLGALVRNGRALTRHAAVPLLPMVKADGYGLGAVCRAPSPWSFVRPGAFLYGLAAGEALRPEPVVTVRARILEIRDVLPGESVSYGATWRADAPARIATLGIGYADGYRWSLGNSGVALVNGARARVRGAVRMGMTMIDVSSIPCARGDVVTLLGADGADGISPEQLAESCGLSPYEIFTGLRQRLRRRYR